MADVIRYSVCDSVLEMQSGLDPDDGWELLWRCDLDPRFTIRVELQRDNVVQEWPVLITSDSEGAYHVWLDNSDNSSKEIATIERDGTLTYNGYQSTHTDADHALQWLAERVLLGKPMLEWVTNIRGGASLMLGLKVTAELKRSKNNTPYIVPRLADIRYFVAAFDNDIDAKAYAEQRVMQALGGGKC